MNSTLNTSSSDEQDLARGLKVIDYTTKLLVWGVSLAVAWSCSTIIMGIIMFIVMAILMTLITAALQLFMLFKVEQSTVASLGHTVGGITSRVSNLFTRKTPVAA